MYYTKALSIINSAYGRSIDEHDARIATPPAITVPLRPHQAAIVSRMYSLEKSLREGYEVTSGERFFSRFGILGDAVGSGKSLMVLSYIAHIKENNAPTTANPPYYHPASTPIAFSFVEVKTNRERPINNLLIVPHTLYRQWMEYCKKQTTLNVFFCRTKRSLEDPAEVKKSIVESDLTIVSNNLYGELQDIANESGIMWERCFIDEADTIHLPNTRPAINCKFTWFITATWYSLLNERLYIPHSVISRYVEETNDTIHGDFKTITDRCIATWKPITGIWDSNRFFKHYTTMHPYRYYSLVRVTDEFRKKSINAPPILYQKILCKASRHINIISDIVSEDVQMALHAGDMDAVITKLGIQADSASNIVNAVTNMQQKELARLQNTLEFKKTLEYATEAAKETALKALEDKIASVNGQIETLSKRIRENNMCYICYEDLTGKEMVVPCCHNVFCATCILTSLTHRPNCPYCRTSISTSELCYIGEQKKHVRPPEDVRLTKVEQLLKLLNDNPAGKFIVFSRYDNPFVNLQIAMNERAIRVEILSGNKDHIFNTQEKFKNGEIQVLLINSNHYCAGMNLEAATHVVLYHAGMAFSEEEQIIGRAYRMGRTAELNVVRLLHDGE
jgi:SNF2 family DNA or RNA helicase